MFTPRVSLGRQDLKEMTKDKAAGCRPDNTALASQAQSSGFDPQYHIYLAWMHMPVTSALRRQEDQNSRSLLISKVVTREGHRRPCIKRAKTAPKRDTVLESRSHKASWEGSSDLSCPHWNMGNLEDLSLSMTNAVCMGLKTHCFVSAGSLLSNPHQSSIF